MPSVNRQHSTHPEAVRERTVAHLDVTFHRVRGKAFNYSLRWTIYLNTTDWVIDCNAVDQALERMPLHRVSDLPALVAPSCLFAVPTDNRIAPLTSYEADGRPRNEPCR